MSFVFSTFLLDLWVRLFWVEGVDASFGFRVYRSLAGSLKGLLGLGFRV